MMIKEGSTKIKLVRSLCWLVTSCRVNAIQIWQVDIISDKSTYLTSQHHYLTSWHNCLNSRLFSNYVDLSDHNVDLSENYVDLLDNDVNLSNIELTSRWQLVALTRYKNKIFSYYSWWYFSDKLTLWSDKSK